ncbi:MAG: hypothetical protein N4A49_07670 [Marinifilaceae bacterium]|jgi:crotonobetainyl-CoA:carnitine CoA-transferase CaiB-like acyl-CoA transferase|nr:hypothetical protein [Marinifilaceae bacterium]
MEILKLLVSKEKTKAKAIQIKYFKTINIGLFSRLINTTQNSTKEITNKLNPEQDLFINMFKSGK